MGDSVALSHALRRMAGDVHAGSETDEFKPFDGKDFVRRDAAGQLERLPKLQEHVVCDGGQQMPYHDMISIWKANQPHTSCFVVKPALLPKEKEESYVVAAYNLDESFEWERLSMFSVIEANIANASADLLL